MAMKCADLLNHQNGVESHEWKTTVIIFSAFKKFSPFLESWLSINMTGVFVTTHRELLSTEIQLDLTKSALIL